MPPLFSCPSDGLAVPSLLPSSESSGHSAFILLIDDDPSVLESVGRVLASDGLRVITASGGRDALECLSEISPALILTDLCMGPLTGWDMILHLQNHQPNLPVFVITALPPHLTGGADRMATAYFQKPLDLDALLAAIHRSLSFSDPVHASNPLS